MNSQEIEEALETFDFLIMIIDKTGDKNVNKKDIIQFYARTLLLKEALED